ncbi:hypothetical protein Tco_0308945 [Tanacetum coccineum]
MDDILSYSKSKEENEVHLKLVLESLGKEKLYAKFSMCEFWLEEVHFLGYVVNHKVLRGPKKEESEIKEELRGMILATQSEEFKQRIVTRNAAETVRDAIGFEYCCDPQSGMDKRECMILTLGIYNGGHVLSILLVGYHLSIQYAPFEALYERKCRPHVLWTEIGESSLTGLELVQETTNKVVLVKEKPKAARDRQKSYVDYRRKPLEFEVGDRVLLKVTPWKGIVCFGKKGRLDLLVLTLKYRSDVDKLDGTRPRQISIFLEWATNVVMIGIFISAAKGRLRCKGVTKQIVGVIPKGLALRVVLVDLHSKDESGKGFKREVN